MPHSQLLISGTNLGDTAETCYFAIFGSEITNPSWFVGNILLQSYYLVLDASPLDEGKNYIQVGIGPKNPKNLIAQQRYGSN